MRRSPITYASAAIFLTCVAPHAAVAEMSKITIAHQFGLGYLPLYVMSDQKLIEDCARLKGAGEVSVEWVKMGSTAVLADGILSGNFTVASAGVPPFIVLWAKTNARVRMISALNEQPMKLNSNDSKVKTISDLTDQDRIAVPAIKTSAHSILLGMAAEKVWGNGSGNKLDTLQVPLSHPDATAALLAGKGQITAHFSTIPFTAMQLANPKIHTILTSTEILGGPSTTTAWWTTERFHDENPKLYEALVCAVDKAVTFVNENRSQAARIYNRAEPSNMSDREVEKIISDPEVTYTLTPERTLVFGEYMYRAGVISKNHPVGRTSFSLMSAPCLEADRL
jgi:NitT/TauT family transport system substrate-binding protein